jgi:hypothetical protein
MTRNVDVLEVGLKPLERLAPREALCGLCCRQELSGMLMVLVVGVDVHTRGISGVATQKQKTRRIDR